jgi:hypothetical protein
VKQHRLQCWIEERIRIVCPHGGTLTRSDWRRNALPAGTFSRGRDTAGDGASRLPRLVRLQCIPSGAAGESCVMVSTCRDLFRPLSGASKV